VALFDALAKVPADMAAISAAAESAPSFFDEALIMVFRTTTSPTFVSCHGKVP
jgi:hypothetical protein